MVATDLHRGQGPGFSIMLVAVSAASSSVFHSRFTPVHERSESGLSLCLVHACKFVLRESQQWKVSISPKCPMLRSICFHLSSYGCPRTCSRHPTAVSRVPWFPDEVENRWHLVAILSRGDRLTWQTMTLLLVPRPALLLGLCSLSWRLSSTTDDFAFFTRDSNYLFHCSTLLHHFIHLH